MGRRSIDIDTCIIFICFIIKKENSIYIVYIYYVLPLITIHYHKLFMTKGGILQVSTPAGRRAAQSILIHTFYLFSSKSLKNHHFKSKIRFNATLTQLHHVPTT